MAMQEAILPRRRMTVLTVLWLKRGSKHLEGLHPCRTGQGLANHCVEDCSEIGLDLKGLEV